MGVGVRTATGAYVSVLAPGKTDSTACNPSKSTKPIFHVVVPITTNTHERRKSIQKMKNENSTQYDEGKERQESEIRKKTGNERKYMKSKKRLHTKYKTSTTTRTA